MSTPVKFFGVLLGVPALILAVLYINTYVYPFQSKQPNFADVEEAFAKLQFPADWQEISSSENRGIAGRGCDPFDASGCFHKNRTFKVADSYTQQTAKEFMIQHSCASEAITVDEYSYQGEVKKSYNLSCNMGSGVILGVSFRSTESKLSVTTRTYQ